MLVMRTFFQSCSVMMASSMQLPCRLVMIIGSGRRRLVTTAGMLVCFLVVVLLRQWLGVALACHLQRKAGASQRHVKLQHGRQTRFIHLQPIPLVVIDRPAGG